MSTVRSQVGAVVVGEAVGSEVVGEVVGDVVGTDVVGEVVGDNVAHETFSPSPLLQYRSRSMLLSTGTTLLHFGSLVNALFAYSTGSLNPHAKYSSTGPSGAPRSTLSK